MRVITGTRPGREAGDSWKDMDTRPTTDRVKEAIFNIIQFDIEGRRVLDLFAGTGQLGIEALSRGAASCTFVDQRKEAVKLVRGQSEARSDSTEKARVVQGDWLRFLSTAREKLPSDLPGPPLCRQSCLENALKKIAGD